MNFWEMEERVYRAEDATPYLMERYQRATQSWRPYAGEWATVMLYGSPTTDPTTKAHTPSMFRPTFVPRLKDNPNHAPAGSPEGGQFTSGPGGPAGAEPTSAEMTDLQKQSLDAAQHIEPLVAEALKSADFGSSEHESESSDAEFAWSDVPKDLQDSVLQHYYENASEDYYGSDQQTEDYASIKHDIQRDLEDGNTRPVASGEIADEATSAVVAAVGQSALFTEATPMFAESGMAETHQTLDPNTFEYDPENADTSGTYAIPALDLAALRTTGGNPLTEAQQAAVATSWAHEYETAFGARLDKEMESDAVSEQMSEQENEYTDNKWNNMSDAEKLQLAEEYAPNKLIDAKDEFASEHPPVATPTQTAPGLPVHWTINIGVDSTPSDIADYQRTGALAQKLAEMRTAQLLLDRYVITAPSSTNPNVSLTDQQLLQGEADVASRQMIARVWDAWKGDSHSPTAMAMQLAIANEFGGVHRLTPDQVKEAERAASAFSRNLSYAEVEHTPAGADAAVKLGQQVGMATLQAYVRAQWETTQYVMGKAGVHEVSVYRGLMLDTTTLPAPESVRVTSASGVNPEDYPYRDYQKLGNLQLLRGGAQSTTSKPSVANNWNGAGSYPKNAERVVVRLSVPKTSVVSLPVFGQNMASEQEVVVAGMKDQWKWDAWLGKAPTFQGHPLTKAGDGGKPLVIDLGKIEITEPYWLAKDRKKALKYSEDQPRVPAGEPGGGQFGSGGGAPRTFDSESGYAWHEGSSPAREWARALSKDDRSAISGYASFGYSDVNSYLRGTYVPPTVATFMRAPNARELAYLDMTQATAHEFPLEKTPTGNPMRTLGYGMTRDLMGLGFHPNTADGGYVQRNVFRDPHDAVWKNGPDQERLDLVRSEASKLDSVIADHGYVLPEDMVVNRAAYIPGLDSSDMRAKVGSTYTENGFTSTMVGTAGGRLDGYVGWGKFESIYRRYGSIAPHQDEVGMAMRIAVTLPKGIRVAAVEAVRQVADEKYGTKNRTESEVLLGSGAHFTVTSVKDGGYYRSGDPTLHDVAYLDVAMTYVGGGSSAGKMP